MCHCHGCQHVQLQTPLPVSHITCSKLNEYTTSACVLAKQAQVVSMQVLCSHVLHVADWDQELHATEIAQMFTFICTACCHDSSIVD